MELTTIDSPAAARRRLRFALRDAREAAGFTQTAVAERLGWSFSKVNRIENGEVTISAGDLKELMELLGVTNPDTVELLTSYARAARRRGWWDEPRMRPHLTPAMKQLFQFEAEATAIRCFQPTLIPGILQTPDYARTILDFWTDMHEETRLVRQEIRANRSRLVLGEQSTGSPYYLVLDESVILRRVGGSAVMAAQLRSLHDMIAQTNLLVRIVPLAAGAIVAQLGHFTIVDLDGEENAILYQEIPPYDSISGASDVVQQYREAFEQMWDVALTPAESAAFIEAHAAIMQPRSTERKEVRPG
jgi:transcriptional regulator with XRE-family HTH domain